MEDPVNRAGESDEERRRREQEEAMERRMLQEELQQAQQDFNDEPPINNANQGNNDPNDAGILDPPADDDIPLPPPPPQYSYSSFNKLSYTQTSLVAAVALLVYALRTRKQWYLALVYIRSSKAAYIVLANALIATCVGIFRGVTKTFLGGLRLHEAEGVGDFFRWNVTETCLALTMFRSELTVSNGILFLILVLAKCLHWVADLREGHLRVTEESIVVAQEGFWKGWPYFQWQHLKLWIMLVVLQVLDILAVQWCGQEILAHGPSVSILFGFEAAILLVSAWNNLVLWHLHALDGWIHYMHEQTDPNHRMHRWIHPWKEHKATFTFAVEVQAQAAKFLFYVIFFAIVLTYYGMPINLFREVYVSFQALKQRLVAFAKYRRLMASMNRFESVKEEELEEAGRDCIICRDDMTVNDCKKLPGCGHIFHKSCLREWLVQQQTCPTCRGDITAMEAEAAKKKTAEAAAKARAEAAEAEKEGELVEAPPAPPTTAPPGGLAPPHMQTCHQDHMPAQFQPAPPDAAASMQQTYHPDHMPAQFQTTAPPDAAAPPTQPTAPQPVPDDNTQHLGPLVEELPPFPALYRVVRDQGADVWDDANTTILRTVPFGVMVLCTTLKYMPVEGFMMRLPDGWCKEDTMVRVRTLASLQQALRDKQQQQQQQS